MNLVLPVNDFKAQINEARVIEIKGFTGFVEKNLTATIPTVYLYLVMSFCSYESLNIRNYIF